jgi:hypothetical protein
VSEDRDSDRAQPARDDGRRLRLSMAAVVMIGLGVGVYVLATVPPTAVSWYPKCTFHVGTGLHCPGCGATRSAHALLNGRPLAALQYNLFAPFLLAAALFVTVRALVSWALRTPLPHGPPIRTFWLWLLLAAVVAYAVARNIPSEPFTHLAPKEIELTPATTSE